MSIMTTIKHIGLNKKLLGHGPLSRQLRYKI